MHSLFRWAPLPQQPLLLPWEIHCRCVHSDPDKKALSAACKAVAVMLCGCNVFFQAGLCLRHATTPPADPNQATRYVVPCAIPEQGIVHMHC